MAALERLGETALEAADALAEGTGDFEAGGTGLDRRPLLRRENRSGLKSIGFFTSLDAWKQLHHLSIDAQVTAEALMNEALNMLFRARGLPEIAPVRRPADSAGQAEPAGDNPT